MTKRRWNTGNTEGFTEDDLPKLDPQTIADALNNSFFEDATARQLERNAARFLGLN